MTDDFPAAHSMDTTWFAVDDAGQVARFDSGEAGAVPNSFGDRLTDELSFNLLAELARLGADHPEIRYDVEDLIDAPDGQAYVWEWDMPWNCPTEKLQRADLATWRESGYDCILWLQDESALQQLPQPHLRLPTPEAVFVWLETYEAADLRKLHRAGLIRRAWLNRRLEPERFGIYLWDHSDACENWISGPYEKRSVPRTPLFVSQLPPPLRGILESVRLPGVRFDQVHRIQPVEHTPCSSWQAEWMDLVGAQHPLPGAEED